MSIRHTQYGGDPYPRPTSVSGAEQVTSSPVVLGPLGSSECEESLLFSYSLFLCLPRRSLAERLRGSTRSSVSVRGGSRGRDVRASRGGRKGEGQRREVPGRQVK